jgi:hypothetical protein
MPYTPTTSAPQVVDDPQPQLGGDLDLNGHAITIGGSPMIDAYGNINSNSVSTAGGSAAMRGDGSASFGNSAVQIDSFGQIILSNLPTTDPGNYGQLWNSGGTLKVSS